ncbi:MAG: fumarylacetoacetate hydrolase family protein [Methanomassiliicoccales archaeon]|nr:fumarylacetoacetate hydrolase family protein [Methanomassiliicoccales archaeon]
MKITIVSSHGGPPEIGIAAKGKVFTASTSFEYVHQKANGAGTIALMSLILYPDLLEKFNREALLNGVQRDINCVTLLPPVPDASRPIFCVGKNYHDHVAEGARAGEAKDTPKSPIFFTKIASNAIGTDAPIISWRETAEIDYEAELVVILKKRVKNILPSQVKEAVFGYTLLNDVTARDLQRKHNQWFKGKNLDTFCPVGPWIVTADEIEWPPHLNLTLAVNGVKRQNLITKDMIFDIAAVVSELSKGMTLEPGDMISTGTGAGCAFGMEKPEWLKPGDVVEIRSEGIGVLRNYVLEPRGESD